MSWWVGLGMVQVIIEIVFYEYLLSLVAHAILADLCVSFDS